MLTREQWTALLGLGYRIKAQTMSHSPMTVFELMNGKLKSVNRSASYNNPQDWFIKDDVPTQWGGEC